MYCTNCGAQLPDTVKFCGQCGTSAKNANTSAPERVNQSDINRLALQSAVEARGGAGAEQEQFFLKKGAGLVGEGCGCLFTLLVAIPVILLAIIGAMVVNALCHIF